LPPRPSSDLCERKALLQKCRWNFFSLWISSSDRIEFDNRLVEFFEGVKAFTNPILRVSRKRPFLILLDEFPESGNGRLVVFFVQRAPGRFVISSDRVRLRRRSLGKAIARYSFLLGFQGLAELLDRLLTRIQYLSLRFQVFVKFRQPSFQILYSLIPFTTGLADLSTDLHSGFVAPFLERTHLSLHLLPIGARVGKSPAHRIQIRLHGVCVGAHPPLFALNEIDLLGSHAANNPTRGNGQQTKMNRFHTRAK